MEHKILDTYRVEQADQAAALLNPLRGEILSKLGEPASASEVARALDEPAQRINYHVKALEKVGLVKRVGTRQVRNLVEVLYQSIAKTFILADTLGRDRESLSRLKDQSSLAHLVDVSARIRTDALALLEHSETGIEIPSAALQTSVCLPTSEARNAFVQDYVMLLKQLVEKYQAQGGTPTDVYNVMMAVYPKQDGR